MKPITDIDKDVIDDTVEPLVDKIEESTNTLEGVTGDIREKADKLVEDTVGEAEDTAGEVADPRQQESQDNTDVAPRGEDGSVEPPPSSDTPEPTPESAQELEQESGGQGSGEQVTTDTTQDIPLDTTIGPVHTIEPGSGGFFDWSIVEPIIRIIEVIPLWVWWQLGLSVGLVGWLVYYIYKQRKEFNEFSDQIRTMVKEETQRRT